MALEAFNAYFSKGKWEILNKKEVIAAVRKAQEEYKNSGKVLLVLQGYTDSVGTAQYNTYLADFRLKAVRDLMEELSVQVFESHNYGEVAEGKLEDNRTVRILIYAEPARKDGLGVMKMETQPVEEEPFKVELNVPQVLQIEFHNNSPEMMPYSYSEVDKLFFVLSDFPDYNIELHGHVCCTDNYEMSYARALTVKDALIRKGIDVKRITVFGHSNKEPLGPEDTEAGMQRNRRVEAVFKQR